MYKVKRSNLLSVRSLASSPLKDISWIARTYCILLTCFFNWYVSCFHSGRNFTSWAQSSHSKNSWKKFDLLWKKFDIFLMFSGNFRKNIHGYFPDILWKQMDIFVIFSGYFRKNINGYFPDFLWKQLDIFSIFSGYFPKNIHGYFPIIFRKFYGNNWIFFWYFLDIFEKISMDIFRIFCGKNWIFFFFIFSGDFPKNIHWYFFYVFWYFLDIFWKQIDIFLRFFWYYIDIQNRYNIFDIFSILIGYRYLIFFFRYYIEFRRYFDIYWIWSGNKSIFFRYNIDMKWVDIWY